MNNFSEESVFGLSCLFFLVMGYHGRKFGNEDNNEMEKLFKQKKIEAEESRAGEYVQGKAKSSSSTSEALCSAG